MYPVSLDVLQEAGTAFIWPVKGGGEAVTVLVEHVQGEVIATSRYEGQC